jgi:hypothetical protein
MSDDGTRALIHYLGDETLFQDFKRGTTPKRKPQIPDAPVVRNFIRITTPFRPAFASPGTSSSSSSRHRFYESPFRPKTFSFFFSFFVANQVRCGFLLLQMQGAEHHFHIRSDLLR